MPADRMMSDQAIQWMAQLPVSVQPRKLREIPRILNKLAAVWSDYAVCSKYLESLLIDDRGDRQGFPPAIMSELIALNLFLHESVGVPQGKARKGSDDNPTKYDTISFNPDDLY